MPKVTSKYKVTVPKRIAEQYGIHPGDEIQWIPAGEAIRVLPAGKSMPAEDRDAKLCLFDKATERHRRRASRSKSKTQGNRGWTREELYDRGRPR
jgi:AbrB family looped-hinge helix DNA binding protein